MGETAKGNNAHPGKHSEMTLQAHQPPVKSAGKTGPRQGMPIKFAISQSELLSAFDLQLIIEPTASFASPSKRN